MRLLLLFIFSVYSNSLLAQKSIYKYRNSSDSTYNAYALLLPEDGEIEGLIIRDYSNLPDFSKKSPYQWSKIALEYKMAILITQTSNIFPELYYSEDGPSLLVEIVHEVVMEYGIPSNNLFIGGMSSSGTRALRYVQFCEKGKSKYGTKIKAAFAVDSPLDLERFYYSASRNKQYMKGGMLWEATLICDVFPKILGTVPSIDHEIYQSSSVYSYMDPEGSNAKWLQNTPILFFHEPDMDWWMNERGATYYDINSFDIIGLVNYLRILGNNQIELVCTHQKGYDREGNRNCHSWAIVDENYLIDWIVKQLN